MLWEIHLIRYIASALFAAGIICLAQAQPSRNFPPGTFVGRGAVDGAAAPTFSGPGDVVSGVQAFYGMRAVSAAYASPGTNVAMIVADVATGAVTANIVMKSDGTIDAAAMQASSACAVSCYVKQWNDQVGSQHLGVASIAAAPIIVFNQINGLPVARFTRTANTTMGTGSNFTAINQNATSLVVAKRTSSFTNYNGLWGTSTSGQLFDASNNTCLILASNLVTGGGCTNNSWISFQGVFAGSASIIYANSTNTGSLNAGTGAIGGGSVLQMGNYASNTCDCDIVTMGFWNSGFDATKLGNMESNVRGASNGYNF
jgi:hypothetical protein